jgi:hypothetical protein
MIKWEIRNPEGNIVAEGNTKEEAIKNHDDITVPKGECAFGECNCQIKERA